MQMYLRTCVPAYLRIFALTLRSLSVISVISVGQYCTHADREFSPTEITEMTEIIALDHAGPFCCFCYFRGTITSIPIKHSVDGIGEDVIYIEIDEDAYMQSE